MNLQFIGATDDVTGSMTLLHHSKGKILIDSGLYQGTHDIVKKNIRELPFDPKTISAIILTHAHLDHSGYIPRLIKLGFRGNIFCTKATAKLAQIIINDSAHLIEKNENNPLHSFYDKNDATVATSLFKPTEFHHSFKLFDLTITLIPAGHILGAASVVIKGEKTIVFSGDLGRKNDPLLNAPENCPPCDIIVMESTYGGKIRQGNLHDELSHFLKKIKDGSKVGIIASFAVARAQMLQFLITEYFRQHPEEKLRVVIDGPMMAKANILYKQFAELTKESIKLKHALENVEIIEHERQWTSLKKKDGPLVIITSSGMVSGGRIWRYLENWQDDTNACLFLPGFQGIGTTGRALSLGERTIHDEAGKIIHWRGEVLTSESFSSHADQNELIEWLNLVDKETQIFLNHGEISSKQQLQIKLTDLGFHKVSIATTNEIKV